jgi:hypothetical protein
MIKIDPVRLPQVGQRNQNRSPPKLHSVVVSRTLSLTTGEPAWSGLRYEIVIEFQKSSRDTELTVSPLLSQG